MTLGDVYIFSRYLQDAHGMRGIPFSSSEKFSKSCDAQNRKSPDPDLLNMTETSLDISVPNT